MGWVLYGVRLAIWRAAALRRRLRRVPPWISFLIESPPHELAPPPGPLLRRILTRRRPPSLEDLRRQVRRVASDARVRGIVLHLRPVPMTAAEWQGLAALVTEARAAGKRVVCWASAYTGATYAVASAADEVLLQVGGGIGAMGIGRRYTFLADSLASAGLRADFVQITPYKTAGDALSKRDMTPQAREMAGWLVDGGFDDLAAAIGARRGLDAAATRELIDGSPYTDVRALELGLVDGLLSEEDLPARLGGEVLDHATAARRLRPPRPVRPGRYVGLIRVEGLIVDGRSRRAPFRPPVRLPLVTDDQSGDLTVSRQARRLAADPRCAAAVLWVDSGGGSATASEAMAAALKALARRKPLVAAMGSVAASGGYYVVTPARRVFARAGTVTGSIGVISGKVVAGGLFDRLLFNREVVARGAHVLMDDADRPYTDEERAIVRTSIERSYEVFVERVAAARSREVDEIDRVAGGRVWTGRQALERGLVDELGGLDAAAAEARRLAGMRADAPLREPRGGRAELPPPAASAAAALEHALHATAALSGATCLWLCPVRSEPG